MQEHTPPAPALTEYLENLDAAVQHLPHGLARDLTAEITAQLSGLDDDELARHIALLGPPDTVAQAALDAAEQTLPADPFGAQAAPAPAASPQPLTATRGYAIAAVIMLGIGGIILPFVGWFIGAALVGTSKLWRTKEKLIGILAAPAMMALVLLTYVVIGALQGGESGASAAGFSGAAFHDPAGEGFTENPLLPSVFDGLWSTMVLGVFVFAPLSALWLFLRLRGRQAPAAPSENSLP
ncbi:hypothetical protein ACI1US_00545 [Leucobacter sp. BZR 635]